MTKASTFLVNFICPRCMVCDKQAVLRLDSVALGRWCTQGVMVQDAFPTMHPDDREMLIIGTHPACWDKMFGGDDA